MKRPNSGRMDVSLEALEAILEQARSAPLSETQIEHAVGSTVQVAYDYQSAQTIPIPVEWREIITLFEHLNT